MPSITTLAKPLRDLPVTLEGKDGAVTVQITYRPHWYTVAVEEELREVPDDAPASWWAHRITNLVTQWDLTDEHGKPIPVTVEAIKQNGIPLPVMTAIHAAIAEDMTPKEKRSATS